MTKYFIIPFLFICLAITSCNTDNIVYDNFTEIQNSEWKDKDTFSFQFDIMDNSHLYDIYLNFRITNDYKYSNIYLQSALGTTFENSKFKRKHVLLATPEGEWFGSGKGKIITLQLPLYKDVEFKEATTYKIQLSQEMRDAILENVTDVGIMVKKGEPVF